MAVGWPLDGHFDLARASDGKSHQDRAKAHCRSSGSEEGENGRHHKVRIYERGPLRTASN
jgi:hypothetical protein